MATTGHEDTPKGTGVFLGIIAAMSGIIALWAIATIVSGLSSVGWSVPEMGRQFLVATGNLKEYETLVDYYTHIKGVEYLIAAAFFFVFPAYYMSLKPKEAKVTTK